MTPPRELLRDALELCLDVHRHPELSGAEHRTADLLAKRLDSAGYQITRGLGGTGVAGVLPNGPGPTVLLRAELDALPITEDTGARYASQIPGVMHACGHDLHLAALAAAASWLARRRDEWSGTVVALGQPAEETLTGARALLTDGLYERLPVPDAVLAQHGAPYPAGTVAHRPGPLLAASRTLRAVLHGRGGHASAPHLTTDPVLTAAAAVLRLQQVVARETDPAEQAVLTIGRMSAGDQPNIIPARAELDITLRALSNAGVARMAAATERILHAETTASGSPHPPELTQRAASPVLASDPDLTAAVRAEHAARLGTSQVTTCPPSMATEDFPWLGASGAELHGHTTIRTVYWMLGTVPAATWRRAVQPPPPHSGDAQPADPTPPPGNHSPRYAPDLRTALPTGITAMTSAALRTLGELAAAPGTSTP